MEELSWEPLSPQAAVRVSRVHRFNTDTILLADFSMPKKGERCAELGAGCGVISLLWALRSDPARVFAVELQEDAAALCRESVERNGLSGVMEVIRAERETLSQLAAPVKLYPQELVNVRVADRDAAMSDPAVLAAARQAEEFLAGQGRVLVRASGTEPLVRTLAEAPTDELCKQANAIVLKALEPHRA